MAHDPLQSVSARHENEAIRGCSRRAADLRDALGPYHPDYATALNQLSLLLIMQGEADTAEPFLREALEIRRITLGEAHPDYATNLSSLGGILWARGELDQAEPILRKVYEIRLKTLGLDHPKTISSQNSLEQLLLAKKKWDEECLGRMQRARLGSANENAATTAALAAVATKSEAPTGLSHSVAENPRPIRHAPTSPSSSPAVIESRVSIPGPLADSIDSIIANHLDAAILEIPEVPPPATPEPVVIPRPGKPPVSKPETPAKSIATSTPRILPPQPSTVPPEESIPRDLTKLFESLEASYKKLSQDLTLSARELLTGGVCPGDDLLGDCQNARERFVELDTAVKKELGGHDPNARPPRATDLEELRRGIESLDTKKEERNKQQRRRTAALEVLREIDGMTSPSNPHFEPLGQCRWEAEALTKAIQLGQNLGPTLSGIVSALADGSHPYHAILRLIKADPSMSDQAWSADYETVSANFSPAMAIALGRGRIVLKNPR